MSLDLAAQVWASTAGQRTGAAPVVALFVVGATLTLLGDGVLLGIGVIALTAFIAVGAAELLTPETLE